MKKSISLEIEQITHSINFPNTGEMIRIENIKNELAGHEYESYNRSDSSGMIAKINIDTIATLTVLCPSLVKDLQVKSLRELELEHQMKLTRWYMKVYFPWYDDILTTLSKIATSEDDDKAKE